MARIFHPELIELSNGIPVILQHYEGSVAATYWWVRTGSTDEKPHQAGFAHFLEHMLFKDASAKETGSASTGQMARTIESLGGDINAYTSFDQTVYHVTCADQHWEKVIDAFGAMAKPQKFLKQDFEREREVILEELSKNEDSPGRQLFQSLFSNTFEKHPYGRPVIGFAKILKEAKLSQLEEFYRTHYVSGKMGLILVGPLNGVGLNKDRRNSILNDLEKHFGSKVLKRKPEVLNKKVVESLVKKNAKWEVKAFDVKTPTLSISFRVPDLTHEDIPALDLMTSVLGMGELSRLYQKLFYQTSLVVDISGGMYVPKDPGMIYFQAETESLTQIPQAAEKVFEEFKKMSEEGPTDEELSRVLVNAESERLYATQTADGLAGRLGFLKYIMGDLTFDQYYLDQLKSVTREKIKEVAKKYFDCRKMSCVLLVPKPDAKYSLKEVEVLAEKILGNSVTAEKSRQVSGKSGVVLKKAIKVEGPEVIELKSGLRVLFNSRPNSHVFSIHASALGGVRLEVAAPIERIDSDWGCSHMMALAWSKGTTRHNAHQISSLVEGSAASLDGFSGRSSIGVQMTGLSRDWDILSELFSEVLLSPVFPKEEIDHARRIVEDSIRSIEDHSSQLCSKLFLETLFQKHPYGKMTYGSMESIQLIHSEKLKAFHKCWMRPERLVISISGAVDRKALEDWIHHLDEQSQKGIKGVSPYALPAQLENEPILKAARWTERSLGREQCHILVGGLGSQIFSEDRHALRLLQTLLGGQSGRLFVELREKKSLAYTVAPVSFEGLERGYIGTYIACAQKKAEEAKAGIASVLEKLAKKGPTPQEMKRAKVFYLGRRAMDLQSDASMASHYGLEALYRVPSFSDSELLRVIQNVTGKDIQRVCQKYLVEPQMVTSSVG